MSFKLNIDKLNKEKEIQPSKIMRNLKRSQTYAYPRDVQDQVWSEWFPKRDERNLVIKMNTGSGKTVVGLLILQSSLNEDKGPALYLCPNSQLAKQVIDTANELKIQVTDDVRSHAYNSSEAICVVTVQTLVNSKSKFGVKNKEINIGSIVIDDAHACLDIIEEQFTLNIPRDSSCGRDIWNIFSSDIERQYNNKKIDLEQQDPHEYVLIPYWDWQKRLNSVYEVLLKNKNEDFLLFKWGLVKDNIKLSNCVITPTNFEISPFQIPIDVIPSIKDADRIVFMTATMADDSVLFSHFNVEGYSSNNIIQPKNCNDIGERIILLPQAIDPEITDEDIKAFCKNKSEDINVVVIVPSYEKAQNWEGFYDMLLDKDNIDEGINILKETQGHLAVLVNRYDGVDLPDNACRLLIIDGLPPMSRYIDKIEGDYLDGFPKIKLLQKIEQGMGRGVRSNLDYCPIILMGKSLTDVLYNKNAINFFSPATKSQYELSKQVVEQLKEQESTYEEAVNMCLKRDDAWVDASKTNLNEVNNLTNEPSAKAVALRNIYNAYTNEINTQPSLNQLQEYINCITDCKEKSFLKQILASYINTQDEPRAQEIQSSAKEMNHNLLTPLKGTSYSKSILKDTDQAQRCINEISPYISEPNKLIILIDSLLSELEFGEHISATKFEKSLADIVKLIGFNSDQPDATQDKGPDVLINISPSIYLIVECKNQALNNPIIKSYCNQLLGSVSWFKEVYKPDENSFSYTPIMIHPSKIFDYHASPATDFRIITEHELKTFKDNVRSFIYTVIDNLNEFNNIDMLNRKIIAYKLDSLKFVNNYTVAFKKKTR